MKFADVVLRQFTGGVDDLFTYQVPPALSSQLTRGSLVKVPFKNQIKEAIVIARHSRKPPFALKKIKELLEPSALESHQLELAQFINHFFLASLSSAISLFLPRQRLLMKLPAFPARSTLTGSPQRIVLTQAQRRALSQARQGRRPLLLFGVSGSGKTEIYLRLAEEALRGEKGVVVLVPEIALTPQTAARFEQRFPNQVALFHSGLSPRERLSEWLALKEGSKKIAVGARSALFAPVQNLGLIIIDEEHDASYKQESSPRYHARRVAEKLAKLTGARLVLGSATPSFESFHRAQRGEYNLIRLPKPIYPKPSPKIFVVDLINERRSGQAGALSELLKLAIEQVLKHKKQGILFLNRRGSATTVVCQDCGHLILCPRCDLPLVYHTSLKQPHQLVCHHCGFKTPAVIACPRCGGAGIRYWGTGTEKVEKEFRELFPKARFLRLDRDIGRGGVLYLEAYEKLVKREADFIIGTQIISKGWDLPELDLVGIIDTQPGYFLPNFNSSERIFQLITQVIGRAGRRYQPGKIIVQTETPESKLLSRALRRDYEGFFKEELFWRRKLNWPPYVTLVRLLIEREKQAAAQTKAEKIEKELLALKEPSLLAVEGGPCFLERLRGKFRYQIVLKISRMSPKLKNYLKKLIREVTVDVEPITLL